MWLNKRNSYLLTSLIKIYTSTHKPVSSKELAGTMPLSESAVRKELQKLESYGFIYKPSASAGRIPTNRAIKHYLKQLVNELQRTGPVIDFPELHYSDADDFTNISDNFLSRLSSETNNIGFIFLNSLFDLNFKRVKLIKVGAHRIMTILQSINNWTFSKIFKTNENYSEKDLAKWENILNREFKGKNLNTTFKRIRNKLHKEKEKYIKIYKELYFLLGNEDLMTAEFFFKGTLNIMDTDLVNPYNVKKLLETLEEKERLSCFLKDILYNNITRAPMVAFGADTGISDIEDFILIFSNFYYSQNPIGNIGVIGPKFMPYPNTISQVDRFSTYFSKILSKKPMEV
ncbi:MAG: HTH domain-containing protein [bacterium]|nr:HTH domain-containing protein [bacterium]